MSRLNRRLRLLGAAVALMAAALGPRAARAQGQPEGRPTKGTEASESKAKSRETASAKTPRDPETLKKNLERWKSMTPAQRAEMEQRHEFLKKCSPQQRQVLTQTYRSFLKLPPDQQAKLKKKLSSLPPEAQKALKKQFEKMRNNPEARALAQGLFTLLKDVPPERFQKLQDLPPEKRGPALRQLIAGQAQKRYLETLPAGERDAWKKKPAKDKRADIQTWLRRSIPPPPAPPKAPSDRKEPRPEKPGSDKPLHRTPPPAPRPAIPGTGEYW